MRALPIIAERRATMKKFLSLVVSFALLAILARPSIAQREEPVPKSLEGQAAAPRGRGVPPEIGGYVTPLGSFDVKPNGIFQYIFGDRFWVRRAAFVQEDSSFWYFKETVPATGWNWAIPKQAGG